jgi:hypothetical protein
VPSGFQIQTLTPSGTFSSDIHVMNVDGTGVTNLTNSTTFAEQLTAWAR